DNLTPWQWMQSYSATEGTKKGPVFGTGTTNSTQTHLTLNKEISALNPDAHWDKSYKMNIGMDLNVLNNRLGFVVEGYNEWNLDMLMKLNQEIPGTVGTGSAAYNYGEMDSWGLEFAVNWSDRIGKDFKYKIGINTGYSDNKVLAMDWVVNENYYKAVHPGQRSDVGSWGLQCMGMFRSYQEINEYFEKYGISSYYSGSKNGLSQDQVHPGMLIYKDVRGTYDATTKTYGAPDGIVNEYDEVRLSNRANPYGLTVNLGAEWKGLSLNAQISASWGGYSFVSQDARETDNIESFSMPSFWNPENIFVYQDIYDVNGNLLVAQNLNGSMPNPAFGNTSATSSFWRVSGTRVQLRRLTLAYTLPKEWLKPIGISSVRFNITGTNLFSFYNPYPDDYMDPLTGSYGNYPTLRNITLGVNVSF
ncbi:MAG: SusC/RagA family protein, partial [Alistipes sp.]|nr:SusC/RagA family protein [Alistipes sp.]